MKILVDAGHGGSDNGATANGYVEKVLNLKCVLMFVNKLKQYKSVEIITTRTTDITFDLNARCRFIKSKDIDLGLSFHFNAYNGRASGTEVIKSIHATNHMNALANLLGSYISNTFELPLRRVFNKKSSHGNADYYGLHRNGSPNMLILEPLFLDNKGDIKALKDDDFIDVYTDVVLKNVVKMYDLRRKSTVEKVEIPEWKVTMAKWLHDKGYTDHLHIATENVDYGTLGAILQNVEEKIKQDLG